MIIELDKHRDTLTEKIIGCAIEVHRHFGPGLLERIYEECLAGELRDSGLAVETQKPMPVCYKGKHFENAYRVDLIVEQKIVIEVKAVDRLLPLHEAQLLSYMKLGQIDRGLLLNFHAPRLVDGIKRMTLEKLPRLEDNT